MIPIIPALALAFISFFASAFVILRIIIPILPPHPLSKRVAPAEFGLPNYRKLSPADKAHVWLASLDMVALAVFIWQTVNEATGGASGFASASDPASSVRLWTILTIRQTILLAAVGLTLLHVRLGRPVSFGKKHWVLWAPSLVFVVTSTVFSGVLSGAGVNSLFYGLVAYTSTVTVVTLITFSCLIGTLFIIKRNLNAINEEMDPWPPVRETAEKPRPSFATEDIDALREGGSWISSNSSTSSRRGSISTWSFSTHHSANPPVNSHGRSQAGGHHSVPAKSNYWFGATSREEVPPVPPLPSPYNQASSALADPDPFRRDTPRPRLESQSSWLTSTNGSHSMMSAWSFPITHNEPSIYAPSIRDCDSPSALEPRPNTPALSSAQVLGGYGFSPNQVERGVSSSSDARGTTLDISLIQNVGWFLFILVPYTFSLPYLVMISQNIPCPLVVSIFFTLSVTLSSPILALNILFKCSFPIPTGLFEASTQLSPELGLPVPKSLAPPEGSYEPKHSMTTSVTVVEGRRSGDVWIAKGDAVDGKSKIGRAIEVLNPCPKLSVIPPQEYEDEPLTPPLPMHDEFTPSLSVISTPGSTEVTRKKTESKASSHFSGADESLAIASRIMIAQRHYSALAQTVILPSTSPEKEEVKATGATTKRISGHLRSRSVTSISEPSTPTTTESFRISPTPPPPFPLPPTPPSVRQARLALTHKKSFSSGFNFQVDDITEIDALTAGVLPLLVPGLKIGNGVKVTDEHSTPGSYSKRKGTKSKKMNEFGLDFSSPQVSSTPVRRPRSSKKPGHRKNHFSLPSLGLGKGGIHSITLWSVDTRGAIDNKATQYKYSSVPSNVEVGWRNTVFGAESIPNTNPRLHIQQPSEDFDGADFLNPYAEANLSHATSNRTLRVDVPSEVDFARLSLVGSAASTVTLFDDIEADFATGPVAESTPHNSITQKKTRRQPPPPLPLSKHTMAHKRSSIVYIKSEESIDDVADVTPPDAESTTISTMTSLAQRAVKPSKLQRTISNAYSSFTGAKSDSNKPSLRPLTLLKNRDINNAAGSVVLSETRPLSLAKKQKPRRTAQETYQDENLDPNISLRSRGSSKKLKPLKLARSETTKMRGILRQTEALPQVIVRPPSGAEQSGFAFKLRDD
ncbi:hypothetical protein D9756_000244 [Leucocoprinus leucothites]|uniref:Uncharacterized protein n=1 Tax=Leucocoprinus leucothites TaxID=201217 RepID=A0A8H5GED9_9AGAR|nr:hypothetical protein D9756_000244 [Leucoagaricus leucothites]